MKRYILINKETLEIFKFEDNKEGIYKLVKKLLNYVELDISFEFKIQYEE